ncbi:hypothetical protein Dsin_006551 [Dipteronia sinensis]|uniref:beta-galactosidase n=1 Tax=Dipteronia sinensis TaxID=43782 RepID=A0AAE0EG01_9ROSI|nr:hypothetical protein Dsin_006551 [Dipteronia sinensis]
MWTENWTGCFNHGDPRPPRTVKDLAFAVGSFFQHSGSLMNYYMYLGGTNFGHTSRGPFITTSYDYEAPPDEYGNLQQPKWVYLRNLHLILLSVQKTLLYGYKRDIDYGNMMSATVYNYEGKCVAFLGNANELEDFTINFQDNNYTVPRCQTSIMVNSPNQVDDGSQPYKLLWVWRREIIEDIRKNGLVHDSVITTNKLLDRTQFGINGVYKFVFEKNVKLKPGTNDISLVSVTVGLQSYFDDIEDVPIGIHGPVQLIDYAANITKDGKTSSTNEPFVWYKTTFPSPLETDPVVVDLLGLGKGEAWVNGRSIGRYWPSRTAPKYGCPYKCDYNQTYDGCKCDTNCGKSTQRYYHIPREFLDDRENVLVLFEEFRGTLDNVTVQTVTVGTVCAHAYDNNNLQLSCQGGRVFTDIRFASFGDPGGTCGSFKRGICEAPWALSNIQNISNHTLHFKVYLFIMFLLNYTDVYSFISIELS